MVLWRMIWLSQNRGLPTVDLTNFVLVLLLPTIVRFVPRFTKSGWTLLGIKGCGCWSALKMDKFVLCISLYPDTDAK